MTNQKSNSSVRSDISMDSNIEHFKRNDPLVSTILYVLIGYVIYIIMKNK